MIRSMFLPLSLLALTTPAFAAQPTSEYPSLVNEFSKACTTGELTNAAREVALAANGWTKIPTTVDTKLLNISRAITVNYDFSKPDSISQWSKTVDGASMTAIVGAFPSKRRYPGLCAVIAPNVRYGWTYSDAFRAEMKRLGIKGKSNDLPHYFEYASKLPDGRPVRAEVFGRSQVYGRQNAMHLYIAY